MLKSLGRGFAWVGIALGMLAGCEKHHTGPSAGGAATGSGASDKPTTGAVASAVKTVRLGYFPNITHAQPLLGVPRGDYHKALPDGVKLDTKTFNAGPSLMEALMGGSIDIGYVGPSPAINSFIRSNGNEVRVIAGAAVNGVLVVGNKARGITKLEQLKGKVIASPQIGNTQDISAKYYVVHDLGSKLKEQGGDTEVKSLPNPDIEILFEKDQIDAAWVPEPWGSRMINKGLVNLVVEEKDLWPNKRFALTNVVARKEFLDQQPDLVQRILTAHVALTEELKADAAGKADALNAELKRLTSKDLPKPVILDALKYTQFTTDPEAESFTSFFEKGKALGLLKGDKLDVGNLIDTRILDDVHRLAPAPSPATKATTSTVVETSGTTVSASQ